MVNKNRVELRHPNGFGPDWANTFWGHAPINNSYLTTIRNGTTGNGMEIHHVLCECGSGVFGLGPQLLDAKWTAGQWTNVGTVYAANTAKAQGGGGFTLETTTNNDGHIISCAERFSSLVYTISTAAVVGDGYTQEWTYWNGTSWAALTVIKATASLFQTQGRHEVVFSLPADAAVWATTGGYAVRYRATDAPGTAAVASRIYLGDPLRLMGAPNTDSTHGMLDWTTDAGIPLCGDGEALLLYTEVAAASRTVSVIGADRGSAQQPGKDSGRVTT